MAERPLILLPDPPMTARRQLHGGPDRVHRPTRAEQATRLRPQFRALRDSFVAQRARIAGHPGGTEPEQVIVLETVGTVDEFERAVSRIPGMEWLFDFDVDGIEPDDDFYVPGDEDRELGGRAYLVMTNQRGMQELLSLWRRFRDDPSAKFPYGLGRWRDVFTLLRDIHPWGPADRVRETGLAEDLAMLAASGENNATVELELWYRRSLTQRQAAQAEIERLVSGAEGQILSTTVIDEIAYHAVVAELPLIELDRIAGMSDSDIVESQHVTYVRPMGQSIGDAIEPIGTAESIEASRPRVAPRIALLDGLPLQNHLLLRDWLVVDDPDGWEGTYPPTDRFHGTAMASLIIHGDLHEASVPIEESVYVRPVLRPESRGGRVAERVPNARLPVDLIHSAITRIKGSPTTGGVAPDVVVVNHSVADPWRMFDRGLSAWARVIDYLAWRYRLLILVSAGNRPADLELGVARAEFAGMSRDQLRQETLRTLHRNTRNLRLAAPAEAVNAVTVGALHQDGSAVPLPANRYDPLDGQVLPSPVTAHGPGYRRSVKPEILLAGGRQTYAEKLGTTHPRATLLPTPNTRSHGLDVASPGRAPGDLNARALTRGTSAATALATRESSRILSILDSLQDAPGGERLTADYYAVLTKAMLAHGASWDSVRAGFDDAGIASAISRVCGYGVVRQGFALASQDERATLLGWGQLHDGEANQFELPLPNSLSGIRAWRRVTVTLAYLTPTNVRHRAYRRAAVWFDPYGEESETDGIMSFLGLHRAWDFRAPRRGTLQHEIFEAETSTAYPADSRGVVQVNCRAEAGAMGTASIPYGIVISLEVAPALGLPIYDEVEARVRPRVEVGVR